MKILENNLNCRAFRERDIEALSRIILDTWQFDKYCSPDLALKMARIYLLSCLKEASFAYTALRKNVPIGVIIGSDKRMKHKLPFNLLVSYLKDVHSLKTSAEFKALSKIFEDIDKADEELLNESEIKYEGEIVLFAVKEDERGKGIGNLLFEKALQGLNNHGVRNYYVLTDTACNYQFYDKKGLVRKDSKTVPMETGPKDSLDFFIYSGKI